MKHWLIHTGAAALLLPFLASASDTQHCYLRDVTSSGTTAYLMCEQGLVYGTTDSGATWTAHDTGASVILHGISFFDTTHGLTVGDSGTMLATDDGGKTWQARTIDTKEHLLTVFTLGNLAWTSGFNGALFQSTDSGRTWVKQKSGTTMALESIFFLDPDHGWAVGWSGTILRTSDGGKNWESIKTTVAQWSLASVRFVDARNGWAAGFSGQLLHSSDGGATWEAQKSPSQSWLTSIGVDKAKRMWIAADDSLLVSEDSGATWKAIPVDGNVFVGRIFPLGNSLAALGELGILRQDASGLKWKKDETFVPVGARYGNTLDPTATTATASGTGK